MPAPLTLLYDGTCSFCRRAIRLCRALDTRDALRPIPSSEESRIRRDFPAVPFEDLDQAMYAITADGRTFRGFFAFRRIVMACPPMWLLLPLFWLPGTSWIGPRVYAWIARNRKRFGCAGSSCTLPQRSSGGVE